MYFALGYLLCSCMHTVILVRAGVLMLIRATNSIIFLLTNEYPIVTASLKGTNRIVQTIFYHCLSHINCYPFTLVSAKVLQEQDHTIDTSAIM